MNANEISAEYANQAILSHASRVGMKSSANDKDEVIVDLLTGIMHLSQEGYNFDIDDMLRMAKERFIVQQKHPLANIIEGDGTNAPDIAVLTGKEIDSGLLSKLCYTAEDAWADAAQRITCEAVPAMAQ